MIKSGDIVRDKYSKSLATVIEVACGGAKVRYGHGGPYGERGRMCGVWEHLIDLELVVGIDHDPGDEDVVR